MTKRKLIFVFLLLFFFFQISVFKTPIFAQSSAAQSATDSGTIDYQLPYPGILPPSPFYTLKVMKDRATEFLMTDPLKKSEFDLFLSDKRLATAQALSQRGDRALSESTLSKGEDYFGRAIDEIVLAKKQKFVINGMLWKLSASSQKHQQVIEALEKNPSSALEQSLTKAKRFDQEISSLLQKD